MSVITQTILDAYKRNTCFLTEPHKVVELLECINIWYCIIRPVQSIQDHDSFLGNDSNFLEDIFSSLYLNSLFIINNSVLDVAERRYSAADFFISNCLTDGLHFSEHFWTLCIFQSIFNIVFDIFSMIFWRIFSFVVPLLKIFLNLIVGLNDFFWSILGRLDNPFLCIIAIKVSSDSCRAASVTDSVHPIETVLHQYNLGSIRCVWRVSDQDLLRSWGRL